MTNHETALILLGETLIELRVSQTREMQEIKKRALSEQDVARTNSLRRTLGKELASANARVNKLYGLVCAAKKSRCKCAQCLALRSVNFSPERADIVLKPLTPRV